MRPEDLEISRSGGAGLAVSIDLVEELGADGYIYAHGESEGRHVDIVARVSGAEYPQLGEAITLTTKPGRLHVFDPVSGERLNGPVGLARGDAEAAPAVA